MLSVLLYGKEGHLPLHVIYSKGVNKMRMRPRFTLIDLTFAHFDLTKSVCAFHVGLFD